MRWSHKNQRFLLDQAHRRIGHGVQFGHFLTKKVQKVQNCTLMHNFIFCGFDQKVLWFGLWLANLVAFWPKSVTWILGPSKFNIWGSRLWKFFKIFEKFSKLIFWILVKKSFALWQSEQVHVEFLTKFDMTLQFVRAMFSDCAQTGRRALISQKLKIFARSGS